ncbi:unnamed protein product [Effrenium voratum]|uniref:Uncharacterized protein n=1 Tax=Effrenium voratum TaxID=2562239 RepID=A0AA36NIQ0_9DINO|nr:unnamed protein product [Effrenium voratum]
MTPVACNSALGARAQSAGWEEAEHLLWNLPAEQPSLVTLNACLSGSAKAREWRRPLSFLQEAPQSLELAPDVISYTTSLSGLKKCRRPWGHGAALLRQMSRLAVRSGVRVWNALLGACRREEDAEVPGEWQAGLSFLESLRQRALQLSETSRSLRLCSLEESAQVPELAHLWRSTLALFWAAPTPAQAPERLASGALLGSLARAEQWGGALEMLDAMASQAGGSVADEVHYDLAIAACAGAREIRETPLQMHTYTSAEDLA